ncbi:sigma-70 family RNA polymerase sigma factor [Singulisphaera sp. Ch08]|uniref:Sigma-70 family RNA polymerase sigma factor n=1 Tax=Singulisphaera sp. Ch08 TaxID=3120278 RepID=A0AAU7CET4_9BACT
MNMNSHWVFNGVDDALKARLESTWAKELPRIQALLKRYPSDLQEIRLTISHHAARPLGEFYEVKAVLQLPTGTLTAEANGRDPETLLDHVADSLVSQVKRHKGRVRREASTDEKARNRAELSAVLPVLQQRVESGDRENFFRLLRPLLGHLRDYVRRELRHLEMNGSLHRGEWTVEDVLDEVMVRAWDRFSNRPRDLELDLWLTKLVDEAMSALIMQEPRPHLSLEVSAEEIMPDAVPRPDESEWWADLRDETEHYSLGDLIPDIEGTNSWEELEAEGQQDRLLSLLDELPPAQRQAFILYALENYQTGEIAKLQGRPEAQVKAEIKAARERLRERLMTDGHARDPGKPGAALSAAGKTGGN